MTDIVRGPWYSIGGNHVSGNRFHCHLQKHTASWQAHSKDAFAACGCKCSNISSQQPWWWTWWTSWWWWWWWWWWWGGGGGGGGGGGRRYNMLIINQNIIKTLFLPGVYDSMNKCASHNILGHKALNCETTCGLQAQPNLNKGARLWHVLAIPSARVVEKPW